MENPKLNKKPWGDKTYSQLICEAILSSPEKKMTVSQIYDWLTDYNRHFRKDSVKVRMVLNTCSYKTHYNCSYIYFLLQNSIRHNLSFYKSRFKKVKNQSPGQSYWWTLVETASPSIITSTSSAIPDSSWPTDIDRELITDSFADCDIEAIINIELQFGNKIPKF